jgi:hypothetical protein
MPPKPNKMEPDVPKPLTIEYLKSLNTKFNDAEVQSLIDQYNQIVIDYGSASQAATIGVNLPDGEDLNNLENQNLIKSYITIITNIEDKILRKKQLVEDIFERARVDINKNPPQGYQYIIGFGNGLDISLMYLRRLVNLPGGARRRRTGRKRKRSRSKSIKRKPMSLFQNTF